MTLRRMLPILCALMLAVAAPLVRPSAVAAQSDNVRVTFQFIEADGFVENDPAIAPIVDQLRRLFRFEGYRLLTEATTTASRPGPEMPSMVSQSVSPADDTQFGVEMQLWHNAESEAIRVSLSIRDNAVGVGVMEVTVNARPGQTIVLGSSKYRPDRPTLIVAFRIDEMD